MGTASPVAVVMLWTSSAEFVAGERVTCRILAKGRKRVGAQVRAEIAVALRCGHSGGRGK